MTTLSIIVSMGFVEQKNLFNLADNSYGHEGDEFNHMAPLKDAKSDIELIIVDRAWPNRWDRAQEALGDLIEQGRVAYIPSKPSVLFDSGYRTCCVMRNSGAICSTGKLLAFVDDYIWLDPIATDRVCEYFDETGGGILCPVYMKEADLRTPEGPPSDFGGHNSGIYMCTREQFIEMNGWDENFDGAYAEEDTEFQNRLDRLLWLRRVGFRKRERGLIWPITKHANGIIPQKKVPLLEKIDDGGYLRCNKSYYDIVCHQRIDRNDIRGNVIPSDEDLLALLENKCTETCGICHRSDRESQVASYQGELVVDDLVGQKTNENSRKFTGKVNTW